MRTELLTNSKIKLTTLSVIVKDKSASMNMLICNELLDLFYLFEDNQYFVVISEEGRQWIWEQGMNSERLRRGPDLGEGTRKG